MKKIINYMIAEANDPISLTKYVRDYMKNSWQPFGGVCSTYHHELRNGTTYSQAMVIYEEERPALTQTKEEK